MQTIRKAPSRAGGVGTTLSLLVLGVLLTLAALLFCLNHLRADIESDLSSRVATALDGTGLGPGNIAVEGLDVTLTGAIETDVARKEMANLTGSVFGVARVYNNLTVGGQTQSNDDTQSDTEKQLSATLLADTGETSTKTQEPTPQTPTTEPLVIAEPSDVVAGAPTDTQALSPSSLQIAVKNGQATVKGIVPDNAVAARIKGAVEQKFGKDNVADELSVFAGTASPGWLNGVVTLIDQLDDISNPALKITADEATVSGIVSSETLGVQKTKLAERLLGNQLTVTGNFGIADRNTTLPAPETKTRAITRRPASLKIRELDNSIRLSGIVSSTEDADKVRSEMGLAFGNFDDELIIDDSVATADWFTDAVGVSADLKTVPNFSVSINSGQMLLGGEVTSRDQSRELQSKATERIGDKLVIVNNYTVMQSGTIADSSEELAARQFKQALDDTSSPGIVFNKNSAIPTEESTVVLDKIAEVFLQFEGQVVEISGHTDTSGDALANLELSKKRAVAVRDYLVSKDVPTNQLRPIGYGETKPVADNTTAEGRSVNRRIEFNLEVESR